jgi:hypothetical protein
LGADLGVVGASTDKISAAMDWLAGRQQAIERKLAAKHLAPQVNPAQMALFVCGFPGNTADPDAFTEIIPAIRDTLGIQQLVLVGDRGMITSVRIDALRKLNDNPDTATDFGWITALRAPAIAELAGIADRVTRGTLAGAGKIGIAVGKVIGKYKMGKHFHITITDTTLTYPRDTPGIDAEAAFAGIYVLRTSVDTEVLDPAAVVQSYENLADIERDFRIIKTDDLDLATHPPPGHPHPQPGPLPRRQHRRARARRPHPRPTPCLRHARHPD